MKDKYEQIIAKGRKLLADIPCRFAEIRLAAGTGTSISLAGDQIDVFTSGDTIGGSVRVLHRGAWGFTSFNDMASLETMVLRAREIAEEIGADEPAGVIKLPPIEKNYEITFEEDFRSIPLEEKYQLIKTYNDILKNDSRIQTTRAGYRDTEGYYIYLNSEGSVATYNRLFCGISLSSVAKDGALIEPYHESIAGYGGYEIVRGKEEMAEEVAKTAVDLLKAESMPGGNYTVVADQKLSGVFIHEAFGHLSEADFVYENAQMRSMMELGREFGTDILNVYDDGSIPRIAGYIPFDDEGVLPRKTALIRNGRLAGRLHSRETAEKMNEEPTGNGRSISSMRKPLVRMTNTYIENGPHKKEDIFDAVDDGIYCCDVIGGQTNLEMFTFSAGYGYEIKNGKKGKMFRDVQLSGNVFTTLKNISMIADDRAMFGGLGGCGKGGQGPLPVSFGGPHMLINDVMIGGRQ